MSNSWRKVQQMQKKKYDDSLSKSRRSDEAVMTLAWDIHGYETLLKQATEFNEEVSMMINNMELGLNSLVLCSLLKAKQQILEYYKNIYTKKRTAASYLLIFMISDELRNRKPYAIPIRFLSFKSITDNKLRELELEIEKSMKDCGMVPVGFTTDGEFNSLRTTGQNRPISIIAVIRMARKQATEIKAKELSDYFKLNISGTPVKRHPAVPIEGVLWLNDFVNSAGEELPFEHALCIFRRTLFPFFYNPCHFVEGRAETNLEILRSIMAIYIFRYEVERLKNLPTDPANFSEFLYQPEKDADTNEFLHHREDHNHLLKRIVNCLREGLIPGIDLRYFKEALHDPKTGLTYEALTGKNKQSVPDCERLISPAVVSFLRERGDEEGARVLSTISNWHKAVDGRGIDEETRSSYLRAMRNWLLDDWMPWHGYIHDYATVDVNRRIKGICGLTREIVVGLFANLDSREMRRTEYVERGLKAEHPRASSSDDVEGFISLLHEMLGPVFDLKNFHDESRKILNEFTKRINPQLPFYYWTGSKERFRDFDLPSFNQPSGPGVAERLDKVKLSRRGDPGVFVANRASLPQKGKLTCRAIFHKAPIALPPVREDQR